MDFGPTPQLLIFSPLGERHFADQLWLDPLNFLGNLGRIFDCWFVCKKRPQSLNRFTHPLLVRPSNATRGLIGECFIFALPYD
jgi:hypothetical protein